ncbi:MAG: hypothetical protein J3Q66DRAFT_168825 [Benniella sp.]|nr:MAG: hypothetical protein J3Q66DRAFT_168825 [Benniella sp.]
MLCFCCHYSLPTQDLRSFEDEENLVAKQSSTAHSNPGSLAFRIKGGYFPRLTFISSASHSLNVSHLRNHQATQLSTPSPIQNRPYHQQLSTMSFPTGLLISPEELAVFAIGSNDAVSFMEKLSKAFSSVAGVNAGIQVENGCLVHLVVLREPIPVENRKSYSEAKGFNSIIFEQIVAPTIYDDQQRADCKARLERGDYLIYKPAPPREWDPLPTRSSSSAPSLVNQGSQTQAIKVHIPMDLLEDFVYDEGADDDGAEQSSKRSRTLRPGRESSFRPHKTATGEIQYRMSVMAFADTGAAIFPRTDRSGTDTYWVDAVKDIMDHAIFKEFVRQEAERL